MIKQYEKYKESNYRWFDKVPSIWQEARVSYFFEIGRGRVIDETELVEDGLYPVFSSQTKNNGCLGYINTYDFDDNILTWSTDGANAGSVFLRDGKFNCTNVCGTLKPKKEIYLNYYLYFLQFVTQFYKRPDTNGAKIMNNEMAAIQLLVPSVQEQIQIALYLDHQTAIIDQIISKKQKLIQLLKEKRQGIINEAVTKGLNPNAKMKESGVEWLGAIPENFQIVPLKHLVVLKGRLGWKGLKAEEYVSKGFGLLSTPDIKNDVIDFYSINYITEDRYLESPEIMLEKDDVLLVKDGSTLGITNIVKDLPIASTVNSSIGVLRVIDKKKLLPEFLFALLTSNYIQTIVQQLKAGQGVPHLFQKDINNFLLILPPINEQLLVIDKITDIKRKIKSLVSSLELQIEKLKEYRQSIISEAVTGKIDVREWQPNPVNN